MFRRISTLRNQTNLYLVYLKRENKQNRLIKNMFIINFSYCDTWYVVNNEKNLLKKIFQKKCICLNRFRGSYEERLIYTIEEYD